MIKNERCSLSNNFSSFEYYLLNNVDFFHSLFLFLKVGDIAYASFKLSKKWESIAKHIHIYEMHIEPKNRTNSIPKQIFGGRKIWIIFSLVLSFFFSFSLSLWQKVCYYFKEFVVKLIQKLLCFFRILLLVNACMSVIISGE